MKKERGKVGGGGQGESPENEPQDDARFGENAERKLRQSAGKAGALTLPSPAFVFFWLVDGAERGRAPRF